jgi:hypothetical protein
MYPALYCTAGVQSTTCIVGLPPATTESESYVAAVESQPPWAQPPLGPGGQVPPKC